MLEEGGPSCKSEPPEPLVKEVRVRWVGRGWGGGGSQEEGGGGGGEDGIHCACMHIHAHACQMSSHSMDIEWEEPNDGGDEIYEYRPQLQPWP